MLCLYKWLYGKEAAYTKYTLLPSSSLCSLLQKGRNQKGIKPLVAKQLLSQLSKIFANGRILVSSQKSSPWVTLSLCDYAAALPTLALGMFSWHRPVISRASTHTGYVQDTDTRNHAGPVSTAPPKSTACKAIHLIPQHQLGPSSATSEVVLMPVWAVSTLSETLPFDSCLTLINYLRWMHFYQIVYLTFLSWAK